MQLTTVKSVKVRFLKKILDNPFSTQNLQKLPQPNDGIVFANFVCQMVFQEFS